MLIENQTTKGRIAARIRFAQQCSDDAKARGYRGPEYDTNEAAMARDIVFFDALRAYQMRGDLFAEYHACRIAERYHGSMNL